jgi:hypothetical protein
MARRIVTRADLESVYGNVIPEDFTPTHWARIKGSKYTDFVSLDKPTAKGISFGYVPGVEEARYAVIPGGKWQRLDRAGIIEHASVRYDPTWVPLHEREGVVYFIQSGKDGPIKIGWSQDVGRRMSELQVANALPLALLGVTPGTMETESEFHARFAHLRMKAEWFKDSPEIRDFIEKNCR